MQEALSRAPNIAAILPSLNGGWNFVPLILLIIAGVSWLAGYWRSRKAKTKANPFAITAPKHGHLVEFKQTIYGTGPANGNRPIEVWVWAGDKKYYRQGEVKLLPGSEWMLRCTFGNEGKPGGSFKIFGVAAASRIASPSDRLPDGPKTEAVLVYREF
ncbi:MAG: hypothetical protein WCC92_16885 [Candidatus Korobacteraceae bacterium]